MENNASVERWLCVYVRGVCCELVDSIIVEIKLAYCSPQHDLQNVIYFNIHK